MQYLNQTYSPKATKQSQAIPGREADMVPNSAGGFAFPVDDWKRLERFLIFGAEGGSYYIEEQKLVAENAQAVARCIKKDGKRVVDLIVDISDRGRAPKNDPALFALAMAASPKFSDKQTTAYALANLQKVARIGTHLFHFASYVDGMRGWGRALKSAVQSWYLTKPPEKLAYQLLKYQSRDGWSHRDLLRLSHPKTFGVVNWMFANLAESKRLGEKPEGVPSLFEGFEKAMKATDPKEVVSLIKEYTLTREMIPTQFQNSKEVWEALLEDMPLEAMIRNLGNLSKCGLLAPLSASSKLVAGRLLEHDKIRKSRLHPLAVLLALKVYASGHGLRGKGEWSPVPRVVDALNDAFYLAFENAPRTDKSFYLGIDVSGSMAVGLVGGTPLTPREAAAAMAMCIAKAEPSYYAAGFQRGESRTKWQALGCDMIELAISPRQRLDDIVAKTSNLLFGGTDCALPMLDALAKNLKVDVFVVLTDSETWAGDIHPTQALEMYRQKSGIGAKLVVVGMVSNGFTIADPNDAGMLDVVGFDASVPTVLADFVRN